MDLRFFLKLKKSLLKIYIRITNPGLIRRATSPQRPVQCTDSNFLALHFLNNLQTFFSDAHYFGHNANLFVGIKENNFSNGVIEAGDYWEALIRKLGNYFIKLSNRYAIRN